MLERIGARDLTENILEDELREVIIDREYIEQDFFDDLIKDAEITDIEGPETIENVIKNAVFLVVGTKDKKIPQFETLDALAELLQKKKFKDNWLTIEDHVELKNLMTLNQRKRSS